MGHFQEQTLIVGDSYIEGTVKELVNTGLSVNGFKLDPTSLGLLMAFGFGDCVGVAQKPVGKSGIAPKIYRIHFEQEAFFSTSPSESIEVEV